MAEQTLYNGARLWQLPELFPKIIPKDAEGFVRSSNVGSRIYLTDSREIAEAYGAIPGSDWVRKHREEGEPMVFFPFGVILSCSPERVGARPLELGETTAKIYDADLHGRLHIAEGPLGTTLLDSVDLVFYEEIVASGANLVGVDMEPMGRNILRSAKRQLGVASYAIMNAYPDVAVNNVHSEITAEQAIALFERT
jgi:hypothetical protein